MQRSPRHAHWIWLGVLLCSLPLLQTSAPARAEGAPAGEPPSFAPRLEPIYKACGKKWARRAKALSPGQREWMRQHEHAVYHVTVRGRPLMTMEVLSTPSFRDCDIRSHWDERETSIRMTYFRADGTRRIALRNFANDHIFFNGTPRFFPNLGKALLKGVNVEGRQASRWLELGQLKELYDQAVTDSAPARVVARLVRP